MEPSRFSRFLDRVAFASVPHSGFMGEAQYNRRTMDRITRKQIKEKANNGFTTKELLAESILKNEKAHGELNTKLEVQEVKVNFNSRFIMNLIKAGIIFGFSLVLAAIGWGVSTLV